MSDTEASEISVTRVAHGVGGSFQEWQRTPPPHSVFMIELPPEYAPAEWCTVEVRYEGGEILRKTNGAIGRNKTPFAHDLDFQELHPLHYAEAMRQIEADCFGSDASDE
jgi:hypothetical protein